MGIFSGVFAKGQRNNSGGLPCQSGPCPYEYDGSSDRDVEGMPFVEGDSRSCPRYGHVCPQYMEAFGLSVEELNIRAVIHCGSTLDHLIAEGQADPRSPEIQMLRQRMGDMQRDYPPSRFPRYWSPTLDEVDSGR